MRSKFMLIGVGIVIGVLLSAAIAWAGNLNLAAGPAGAAGRMYTLYGRFAENIDTLALRLLGVQGGQID